MNKRGLSGVVAVTLIVLITIAAVVIVWAFIRNVLVDTGERIDFRSLVITLSVENVKIDPATKNVKFTIKRGTGDDAEINSTKIVLQDSTGNLKTLDGPAINELESKIVNENYGGLGLKDISKISIAAVVANSAGKTAISPTLATDNIENQELHPFTPQELGLLAYWDFEDNLMDKSGNGYNGNFVGDPAIYNSGKIGKAIQFDGSDDNINLGQPQLLNTNIGDLTIAVWTKLNVDLGYANTNYVIFSNEEHQVSGYLFRIEDFTIAANAGKIHFRINILGTYESVDAPSTTYPNDQNWHHLVIAKNGTQGKIYLNGIEVASGTINNPADSNSNAIIGGPGFNGMIDEIRIYNRALSLAEIKALYEYA